MSEFGPYNEANHEANNYTEYNEQKEYEFVIRESIDKAYNLSPVDAYTFLAHIDRLVHSIIVLHNNLPLVSLSPEYGTRNYIDSIWGISVTSDPYSIFQHVKLRDSSLGGRFEDFYNTEYTPRKATGEEVYNPFSQIQTNLNWKSEAKIRKNTIKKNMIENFNRRFRNIKAKEPYGTWKGATPNGRSRKLRSRKTRKNRR
jgi:hypothetical protein